MRFVIEKPRKFFEGLDLEEEIIRLKKERQAIVLAHYYQDSDIQDVADFLGDSLALAQAAQDTDSPVIVFCGVHFMAETAKILNPDRLVLLPDLEAGCSLADSCSADDLRLWRDRNPEYKVISYINCTAEVKALSDLICTSSNAEDMIRSFPEDQPLMFAPDKNLGAWLIGVTGRPMKLWQGACVVHESFSERKIIELKIRYPQAPFIAHPECEASVLRHADFVGSTTALLKESRKNPATIFIVGTEIGILHQMKKLNPTKRFIEVPFGDKGCACNECPHMRLNSLEKLYLCLKNLSPSIELDPVLIKRAYRPLKKMLDLSLDYGKR